MNNIDVLIEAIGNLDNPRFKDERQLVKLMTEILNIHSEVMLKRKVNRKLRRRIQKVWRYGLPTDLYKRMGIIDGLNEKQIKSILNR